MLLYIWNDSLVSPPPLSLTRALSHTQLGTAVRHVLGKYREADSRARRLNAELQEAQGRCRKRALLSVKEPCTKQLIPDKRKRNLLKRKRALRTRPADD
jgi:hypothetical protein